MTLSTKINLLDLDRRDLEAFFVSLGEKPFRAAQIMKWIYHERVIDFAAMSDADLKQELDTRMSEIQSASFDHSVKGIANPMELRDMRRNIARINTEMRKRELAAGSAEVLEGRSKLRARRSRQKKQA